jgi:hypothetical protein
MSDKAASEFKSPLLYGAGLGLLAVIAWAGLHFAGGPQPEAPMQEDARAAAVAPIERPLPTPAAVEKAKVALAAESKVVDLVYDPSLTVQWNIAVADDGTRRDGLADYFCLVLAENEALTPGTKVRIVDAAKRAEFKDAYRDYELGAVDCSTNQPL